MKALKAAERKSKRLFICDPACVQEIGHNLHALISFRKAFGQIFDQVIPVATLSLPEDVAETSDVIRHYRFYYPEYFPSIHYSDSYIKKRDNEYLGPANLLDRIEIIATADAISLINLFNIGRNDCILFPHLDFYGVVGVLNALALMSEDQRPTLALRFIGVMENASKNYTIPCNELLLRIRMALSQGVKIAVSAETARYADALANVLEMRVPVTGYPLQPQFMPMENGGPFYFYCPGSARADKGFFELREIFSEIRARDPFCDIRFISQIVPDREAYHHMAYIRQLNAIPGVELQAGAISPQEMIDTYKRTHGVLLPYASDVYEYRGSAVLMEAASYARPVIAYDRTGFSSSIEYYGLGRNVSGRSEMIKSIMNMAEVDRHSLSIAAQQGGYRFHRDNVSSFTKWLKYNA